MKTLVRTLVVAALATACATPPVSAPARAAPELEDIYVLRSIRERHEPSASCSTETTGFDPFPADAERFFSFWSVEMERGSGRVSRAKDTRAAELRGCFGPTGDPARQRFHAEIALGQKAFSGDGECDAVQVDFPQAGLFSVHCWLVLSGLPAPYVGGLLTTNTLTSRAAYGGDSDPRGYTQASLATIRLWKTK